MPALSLAYHLVSLLLFDLETHNPLVALVPSLLVNILVDGVIQPLLCSLVSLIICPLLAGCIAAAAITRKGKHKHFTSFTSTNVKLRLRFDVHLTFH